MTEKESYVTKADPSVGDWMEYNEELFTALKGTAPKQVPRYAPLVDVDIHAAKAGVSTEQYYEQIKQMVGPLGKAALRLVHSDMDDAWHIIVGLKD